MLIWTHHTTTINAMKAATKYTKTTPSKRGRWLAKSELTRNEILLINITSKDACHGLGSLAG